MVAPVIRGARTILLLLTALNLLNYLDRFVLSAVLPSVQDDLRFSNFVGGSLATVFLIGYFATSPIFGVWADRAGPAGRKGLIAVGVAVWSAATIASGLAGGTVSLIAARAVVGVGEASFVTIAPTIIDDVAPPLRRARWQAIFWSAVPIGSALGYVVGGTVLRATHDWRSAFFVAGGPGLVLGLLALAIAMPQRAGSGSTTPDIVASARELLRRRPYVASVLGYCAFTFAIGGFAFWAPKYLHARYGLETGSASRDFGLLTVLGGLIGTLAGGALADRRARGRTDDESVLAAALWVCALSAGLGAPLAAGAILAGTPRGFFCLVFPCEIALFLGGGPINVALLRSAPPALRASAMAMATFAIHLLGDLWSPPLIGLVADQAPIMYAMLLVPVAFAVAAIVWWRAPVRLTGGVAVR
jgi:MFS family permease